MNRILALAITSLVGLVVLVLNAIVLFLIITFTCSSARAEAVRADEGMYVSGSVGASIITALPPDGTWHQDGLPNTMSRSSLAFKGGLGYRGERWFIEGNYLHMGGFDTKAQWVPDEDYDATNHVAITRCREYAGSLRSSLQGGEVVVGYLYPIAEYVSLKAKAGVWGGRHDIKWRTEANEVFEANDRGHFVGLQLGPTVGGGICFGRGLTVCGEVSYYYGLAATKYPVAHEIVLPTLTINIPVF